MPTGKQSEAALAKQLIAGTNKHLSTLSTLMFGDGSYTPAQVTGQLQNLATLRDDVTAAQATTKAKLAAEKAEAPTLIAFMHAFIAFVKATYSKQPDVLLDFGLKPNKKPAPLTVEQKAAARAKRQATRQARGTTSKKKKQAIKGNVTGVVVTPITAPENAPATSSEPAGQQTASNASPPAASTTTVGALATK